MTVFILIIFAAVAAACYIMLSRLYRLNKNTDSPDTDIYIALDDISAAGALFKKLEPVSGKYPSIRFSFYTANFRDIIDTFPSGRIDFAIILDKSAEDKLHYVPATFTTRKTVLTEYDIAVEPLCPQDKELYIIFCPERQDNIKNEILKALEK